MSVTTLVQLEPRRAADAVVEVQRLVHNARVTGRFMGEQWQPHVIQSLPDFELDLGFADGKFGQGATPQVGRLVLAVGRDSPLSSMIWTGSTVTLWTASWPAGFADAADADFSPPATYVVETHAVSADGQLTLTLLDNGQPLRNPLLSAKFGSTANPLLDGAGATDHAGKVVPMGWGRMLNVPAMLIDRVYNIWLLIGRPTSVFHGVFDGGAPFTAGAVRADLAALRANTPAAGSCDVCGNAGGLTLVRPWTTPVYPLTADITATGPQTAGDIALAVVAMRSAIYVGDGVATAFNALYPYQAGLFVDDERTAATALDRLMAGLGAYWKVLSSNSIELARFDFAAPVKVFAAHDLISVERESVGMPNRRRAVGWGHNNRVHSESEIALAILDLSGLGALATMDTLDWALVTGAGRPDSGATRNIDGGNLIRDPIKGSDWYFSGAAVFEDTGGGSMIYDHWRARLDDTGYVAFGPADVSAIRERFAVTPGETMFAAWWGYRAAGATNAFFLVNAYDSNGTYLTTVGVPNTQLSTESGGEWTRRAGQIVIPEGWAFAWPHVGYNSSATGGLYVAYPYFGRSAQGADITGQNTALNTLNVGSQSAAALVLDAAAALANASSALSAISIITSDGYLSRAEKPAIIKEVESLTNEIGIIGARAVELGLTAYAAYATWDGAWFALASYLGGLTPAYNNLSADTPIVGATFRGRFTDYYYARQLLLDLFTAVTKTAADVAQAAADNAQAAADNAQAAADAAQANAESRMRVFYQEATPAAPPAVEGNTWLKPSTRVWSRYSAALGWQPVLGAFAAANIIDNSNIAMLLAAAVIGDAYITDLNAAKITAGVINTSRLNLDGITLSNVGGELVISNGGVDTAQLAPNAAVILATYDQVGTSVLTGSYATIVLAGLVAQVTLTNSTPYAATITFAITANAYQAGSDSDSVNFRLMDGASLVGARTAIDVSGNSSRATTVSLQWTVTIPASTTKTYTLQASSNDSTTIRAVVIHATMFKRV